MKTLGEIRRQKEQDALVDLCPNLFAMTRKDSSLPYVFRADGSSYLPGIHETLGWTSKQWCHYVLTGEEPLQIGVGGG